MISEKELQEKAAHELADSKRQLDRTIPGGVYINDSGYYVNADGMYVDEYGRYVEEPIAAKEAQAKMEADRQAAIDAEAERVAQLAQRRADDDKRAADAAKAQADRTAAEAKLAAPQKGAKG